MYGIRPLESQLSWVQLDRNALSPDMGVRSLQMVHLIQSNLRTPEGWSGNQKLKARNDVLSHSTRKSSLVMKNMPKCSQEDRTRSIR